MKRLLLFLLLLLCAPAMAQQEELTAPYAYRQLDDPAQEVEVLPCG